MTRAAVATAVFACSCVAPIAIADPPTQATEARIAAADDEAGSWLTHGRTYDEQRHSPLDQIHRDNVNTLGLAWSFDAGSRRGMEATPLVIDGVLYATAAWSIVHAMDATTGAPLWSFDPQVPRWKGRYACCDVVNRGVAY